jgi:hypothetical protein
MSLAPLAVIISVLMEADALLALEAPSPANLPLRRLLVPLVIILLIVLLVWPAS